MDTVVQLRKFAYALKNSTTILLPEWIKVIKKLATESTGVETALSPRIMPRDVSTRWNSTYDMLKFAYTYREAINKLTDNRSLNLGWCRIMDEEWELVKQLRDVLKVSGPRCNRNSH
jgi:hypothetical protein